MSVENWTGSMKDKLIIDQLYYKSPMGMEWKRGGLSFVASYLSEFGSDMIAPNWSTVTCWPMEGLHSIDPGLSSSS